MSPDQAAAIERLHADMTHPDAPRFLLEHLATWGPGGIDVAALASRALEMAEVA